MQLSVNLYRSIYRQTKPTTYSQFSVGRMISYTFDDGKCEHTSDIKLSNLIAIILFSKASR